MDSSDTLHRRSDSSSLDAGGMVRHLASGNADLTPASKTGSSSVGPRPSVKNSAISPQSNPLLGKLYGPVMQPLAAVEGLLRSELQSPIESVSALLRHGVQLGGKRLRPAIHLLMAEALGGSTPANVTIGTVLEMVHTATLVHDDVLDEAQTRRHVPTINAQWDNHTSILLGDYLFAQSFRLAATLENTRTCQWVGEAARLVCEGELRQILGRNDVEIDQETYFEVIQGKTAELCRVACSLAAAQAGCEATQVDRLAEYGNSLGIAFQIADDFLDLWGDDSEVGKTLGTDLEQGKITLPVIRLLETCDEPSRGRVLSILTGPPHRRVSELRPWLEKSDARDYTHNTANRFRDQALAAIKDLPETAAKGCLVEIAQFSVQRSF